MNIKISKIRLDQLLVSRGLIENASKARARIMAGDVIVAEQRADKPGDKFAPDISIRLRGNTHPFVSRGGLKLEHALHIWPYELAGVVCMDVGASTGGFSEVLLQNQAAQVYAVDVGYGQLAHKLRGDTRVINLERTHILHVKSELLQPPPSLVVIDVSFISVTKILAHIIDLMTSTGRIYALVKPQFEVGRELVAKGGIVKSSDAHWVAIDQVVRHAADLGLRVLGIEPSPILGAKGNTEFLLALAKIKALSL